MREINRGYNYINVFNNINEFVTYLEKKTHKKGRSEDSQTIGNEGFYGTNNYDEAIKFIKYGDEKLFNSINNEIKKININTMLGNVKNKTRYQNDVCGVIPNVPNMMVGSPLTMINIKKEGINQKVINIFINTRVPAYVDGEDVIKTGIKYLNVIDMLEKKGYRCNLYSGCANSSGIRHCCLLVRVKTDREPLNLKKICFTIANPAMQRRLKWKWMEVNDFDYDFTDTYGGGEDESYIKKELKENLKEEFIIWDYESENGRKSVEQLIKDLGKYGINIEL